MKRRWLTYEKAKLRHDGCHIELRYIVIDESYPNHDIVPMASAPAILVWHDKAISVNDDDGSNCTAIYWLQEDD